MDNPDWEVLETYNERTSAEAVASWLRAEDVPTLIKSKLVAGIERGFRILVPSILLHRARLVVSQYQFSDAELNYLATGELSGSGENNELKENKNND